ncbi:phosphatidate cytidylyltransferase [Aquirhabdus sp.]|uniref:phosphatidate cytidylyltransferase n=1 Tax=Aquirhabdus sp. TaxID=2824160 RepID=UPI00396CA890
MFERIRTGLILIAIVLLCLFATKSPIPIVILMIVTLAVGANEWTKFGKGAGKAYSHPIQFVLITFGLAVVAYNIQPYYANLWPIIWGVASVFWLSALVTVRRYPLEGITSERWLPQIGILLLIATTLAIYSLWSDSPWWLMYLFALVWVADSGAYFTGKFFGKHKLIPDVSPNKTVEGLIGGLALACVVVFAVAYDRQLVGLHLVGFIVLSVITMLASVLGDLFESLLKRKANIKDSGTLLPGHGGVLDRIDSLLAAAPIFAFGFWLAGGF